MWLIIVILVLTGCSKPVEPWYNDLENGEINLVDSVNNLNLNSDPYNLNSVWVTTDSLFFSISYSGGCREHIFRLIARYDFVTSADSQIADLYLVHESNNDMCEAWITEKLGFSLQNIRSLYTNQSESDHGVIKLHIFYPDQFDQSELLIYSF